MQIILHPTSGAPVTLAGSAPVEGPRGLKISGQLVVEMAQFPRADNAKPTARGNRQRTVSFGVTRKHVDERTAEAFLVKHESELPEGGTLELRATDANGGETSVWLLNAQIQTAECEHIGVSTLHSYVLVCGKLSTTQPT